MKVALQVAYLADSTIPSRAANSVHVMKMCAAMATLGHRVTLLTSAYDGDPGVFAHYGVEPSFSLARGGFRFSRKPILTGLAMALRARRLGADLVLGRHITGCFFASLLGLRVLFETHDDSSGLNRLGRAMVAHLLRSRSVARVVVISERLKAIYAARHPAAASRLLVAHDGADPSPAGGGLGADDAPGTFRVGYLGQLYAGRGIEIIVELARRCPWATFYVVGGGAEDVERWRREVRDLPNLRFLGFLPPSRVEAIRSAFDALLAPYQRKVAVSGNRGNSVDWMSPLKVFEYMSSGRPMVASDLPALKEVLADGVNALLCVPDDPAAWESALLRLRDDRALREGLAARALADFRAHYTWTARAERLLAEGLRGAP